MMLRKKCLAFLCIAILVAAVTVAPASATVTGSGTTDGGTAGSLNVTAKLSAYPAWGEAFTTTASVTPPANPTTSITIRCVSTVTGNEHYVSASGSSYVSAQRPDSTYSVREANSTHKINNTAWGYWFKGLYEMP